MDLAEAVEKLNTKNCTLHEHAAAGAFLGSYYATEGRHLLRPVLVSDMTPRRTRDQAGVNVSGYEPMPNTPNANAGGSNPGSPSGGTLIQELDGPVSAFVIVAHGNGRCGLYRIGRSDNVMDPGAIGTGVRARVTDAMKREIAADALRSRQLLQSINRRNREVWGLE